MFGYTLIYMNEQLKTYFIEKYSKIDSKIDSVSLANLLCQMKKENVEIKDCIEIVKTNPELANLILRSANSPYYGRENFCKNIYEAVQTIGLNETEKLIALQLSKKTFSKDFNHYGIRAEEFLQVSLLTALIMENLAPTLSLDKGNAYTVGLIHGVCRNYVNLALEEKHNGSFTVPRIHYLNLYSWEETLLGINHADVSGIIMDIWGFPQALYLPVAYQFNPTEVPRAKNMTYLLVFSMSIAASVILPESSELLFSDKFSRILMDCDFSVEKVEEEIPEIIAEWQRVKELFF